MRAPLLLAAIVALVLAGCATRRDAAPVVDRAPTRSVAAKPAAAPARPPQTVASPAQAGFYVVKRGDTLYSIALDHGADYRDVAQWNGLDDPTRIQVGQQLRVSAPPSPPGAVQIGSTRGTGRIEARPLDAPPSAPEKQASVPRELPKPEARPDPKPEVRAEPEATQFMWPAKGKVLAGFAEPRSKGIDIDGKPGDPIVAAAAGRVTYIGNGIPGLGKLIVIKHENGFITVYAHNREIFVKEQQAVTRGQKIAELGSTDSDRPKLHFQIRKGSAPVDPLRYLPGS